MACKVKLLLYVDFLITEDYYGSGQRLSTQVLDYNAQTTPLSATSRALIFGL